MNIRFAAILRLAVAAVIANVTCSALAQVHGAIEFTANGTFTCPSKVKQVQVELWGSGGNGGSAGTAGGGGGGAGGYARGWVTVKSGQTYQVNVGNSAGSGAARSSWFADPPGTKLISASGGAHGQNGASNPAPGGTGGSGFGASALTRTGSTGGTGITSIPGIGAFATAGTIPLTNGIGVAAGGNGAIAGFGLPGGRGHVIVTW
jgi:hypothetical protein